MDDLVFCCVAFGIEYQKQQVRLRHSIRDIYPHANFNFYTNEFPPGSRDFYDSLYGFKPHLVQDALNKGFKRVICLDPAMILVGKIDLFLKYPVVAVKDESLLWNVTSERCAKYYRMTREEIKENNWHLVGGSFYYFDFYDQTATNVFQTWHSAEINDLFGSQYDAASEKLQGHRYDETLMALAMYFNDVEPQDSDQVGYCRESNSIWKKLHFK